MVTKVMNEVIHIVNLSSGNTHDSRYTVLVCKFGEEIEPIVIQFDDDKILTVKQATELALKEFGEVEILNIYHDEIAYNSFIKSDRIFALVKIEARKLGIYYMPPKQEIPKIWQEIINDDK